MRQDIQTPGTGCPPPELSLNQTRVLARRNSTPDFRTFSEVKFTAQFPGPGFTHYTRLCKIKCINEKWVGPLCLDEDAEGKYEPILHGCQLGVIPSHLVVTYNNVTLHGIPYPPRQLFERNYIILSEQIQQQSMSFFKQ
ncbi:hypothetical protein M8J76_002852 [Diaphorina citri]|nr:hypothetical protein M8J75_015586 [Diaphorina citri]KAI5729471.1 hypothetical protein M8J76_002852 [Diaphorina citri]